MVKESTGVNKYGRTYHYDANDYFSTMGLVYSSADIWGVKDLRWVRRLKPNARTIIDVGMNVGMGVIEYATWANNVHGFEPIPDIYNLAVKNIIEAQHQKEFPGHWYHKESMEISAVVNTYNMAVGNKKGKVQFKYLQGKSGMSYIDSGHERSTDQKVQMIEVDVVKLDDYAFTDVDILKIDTEGFEYNVLCGAIVTIMSNRPVVQVEYNTNIEQYGKSHAEINAFFQERGYRCTVHTGAILKNPSDATKGDRIWVPEEHEYFSQTIDTLF